MDAVLTSDISVIAVFLQGLFSFFSPCVLPLLPVYFGYLSGGTAERNTDGSLRFDRGKVLLNTLLFVLGISTAFFLLGLGASAAGGALIKQQKLIMRIGGILMILFGLYQYPHDPVRPVPVRTAGGVGVSGQRAETAVPD